MFICCYDQMMNKREECNGKFQYILLWLVLIIHIIVGIISNRLNMPLDALDDCLCVAGGRNARFSHCALPCLRINMPGYSHPAAQL